MNELFDRQVMVLRSSMESYCEGAITLNTLIQRIEGVSDVIGVDEWKVAVFPMVLCLEQINASVLELGKEVKHIDQEAVKATLVELESLIRSFEVR